MLVRPAGLTATTLLSPRTASTRALTPTGRRPTPTTALITRDSPRNGRQWLGTRPACTHDRHDGTHGVQSGPASHACTDTRSVRTLDAHGARSGDEPRSCLGITPEPPEHPCFDLPRKQPGNQLACRKTPRYVHREREREAPLPAQTLHRA